MIKKLLGAKASAPSKKHKNYFFFVVVFFAATAFFLGAAFFLVANVDSPPFAFLGFFLSRFIDNLPEKPLN
jgi:hypothetical protein